MFDAITSGIPDSISELFSTSVLKSSVGAAGQAYNKDKAAHSLGNLSSYEAYSAKGTSQQDTNKAAPKPTATKASESVDPQVSEAAWMARLSKFAGIVSATGAKIGG